MVDISFIFYALLLMTFEISGQLLFKKYYSSNKNKNVIFAAATLMYCISSFFVFKVIKYGSLGLINVVWHAFHFTTIFMIGYFVLGEKYTTKQLLASILGLLSLGLFMIE